MSPAEETVWHAAAARGDAAAWEWLFRASYAPVAEYVQWRCAGQVHLADEVLQETWLLAARKLANFSPQQGRFIGWVCGLAANVLRNQLRSQRRRERRFAPLNGSEAGPSESEHAERVAWALAQLPDRYEAVLRAKYLEQSSVAAIAESWGETPKAIESLLSRARDAFRQLYQQGDA